MKFDVFLSHVGANKLFIEQMAASLEPDLECWYAPRNILSTKWYNEDVLNGIEDSKIVLVYLTKDFEEAEENFAINEVIHARTHKKKILPVVHGINKFPRSVEMHLNATQWFDLNGYADYETAFEQLKEEIRLVLSNEEDREIGEAEFYAHVKRQNFQAPEDFIPISSKLQNKYERVFIPSFNLRNAQKNGPVQVFYGKEQSGKVIHAVNYFYVSQKELIFEATTIDALKNLMYQTIHRNSGFIVKVNSEELVDFLTENWVEEVRSFLEKTDSELVLCTDKSIRYMSNIQVGLPENKEELLLQHLHWQIEDPYKLSLACILLEEVKKEAILEEISSMEGIHELSREIWEAINEEKPVEEFLKIVRYLSEEDSQKLFQFKNETDILCHLAIAASHGKSYNSIVDMYQQLLKTYKNHFPAHQIGFHMPSQTEMKKMFGLKALKETTNNHLGNYEEERLYYEMPLYSKKMWPIVWNEYPYLQSVMAEFLIESLNRKNNAVIEKLMLSILETSFQRGLDQLIYPMAKSSKLILNKTVKKLLIELYSQPKLKLKVYKILENWIKGNSKPLEFTAILTFQSEIGLENYAQTMEWLIQYLQKGERNAQVHLITFSGLSRFIYVDKEAEKFFYKLLLTQMREWVGTPFYKSLLQFLMKLFTANSDMYFKGVLKTRQALLIRIMIDLTVDEEYISVAMLIRSYMDASSGYPEGKEQVSSLLRDYKIMTLADEENTQLFYQFKEVIQKVKEGA